jgi:hypothetical protein
MNPYLEHERVWPDFHDPMVVHIREALNPQIAPNYFAKLNHHVYIHEPSGEERRFLGKPDISVARSGRTAIAEAALQAPAYGRLPVVSVERQLFIEIMDRESSEIVAVIELLSPANKKPGPDREQYLGKRGAVLSSNSHLIEIDLLRGGPRLPLEELPVCDYYAMVSRATERPRVGIWPIALRDSLPNVPVPLREPHADARIPLRSILDQVYDTGRYGEYIYNKPPPPPMSRDDAAWAAEILKNAGQG